MPAREKTPSLPAPLGFAPLGQAVMETFSEGVVVFDPYGGSCTRTSGRVVPSTRSGTAGPIEAIICASGSSPPAAGREP